MIDKEIIVFTPVNPLRPFAERLKRLHHYNVMQNDTKLYDYEEVECVLPSSLQKEGLYRGQNVIVEFNECYVRNQSKYNYICKWDDDFVLPSDILQRCLKIFRDEGCIGVGMFQESYGSANILKVNAVSEGWTGAFSRFYIYRMKDWNIVPVILGSSSGDPDNAFQKTLDGAKYILNVPSIHLDHRCCKRPDMTSGGYTTHDIYKVFLDMAEFLVMTQ